MSGSPLISVLLPVYNSAAFVAATLQSILSQTEGNFELLVLNDGSTDESEQVIRSFSDSRIRYFHHPNMGLVGTLNRGIAEAKGTYIARIDADDICLPERFAKQAAWLEAYPQTALVGCFITFINEEGVETGTWPADRQNYTATQVRRQLPYVNCIAHPGVMVRTVVLRQYLYNPVQQHIEDYDLWLRMQAKGEVMEKVPEALLLYRVHSASVTTVNIKRQNLFFKQFHCKRRYLAARLAKGSFNGFDARVVAGMCKDGITGIVKWIKQRM
ncbi:glycosyltransferase [Chitinophaga niabensis]|uniref:glycosyltransferase family 2 protein n=1 Tax=Chitinophaga niabensis TaxID=536979 RepID=UPI0031BA8B47